MSSTVWDVVYLNPLDNFNQWYNPYEKGNQEATTIGLDTVILTKVKVKSINDVALLDRASNKLRFDWIRN